MANILNALSTIDEIAYLAGIFNWQMSDASFTNNQGQSCSFHVLANAAIPGIGEIPLEQYIGGEINTYNLITGPGSGNDPNLKMFNTFLNINGLQENIKRKYTVNRIPFANYDQPVNLGVGGQTINFNVVFCGTLYQTAWRNFAQVLFTNNNFGLGTLNHPFYNEINNVLPIEISSVYDYKQLNCVILQVAFVTSDLSHLSAGLSASAVLTQTIQEWFIGTQNAITSIGGTISSVQSISSNIGASL